MVAFIRDISARKRDEARLREAERKFGLPEGLLVGIVTVDDEALVQAMRFNREHATRPLAQVAQVRYELEEPVLWRRNRDATLTVRSDLGGLNLSRVPKVFIECGNMRNPHKLKIGGLSYTV